MNYIEVNDQVLDFDGKISMVLNNPMFVDEIDYSLQFTVNDTINNRAAFGYINRPDIKDNATKELNCKITFGSIIYSGTLTIKYSGGNFSCYFKRLGTFWSEIKDKYLKDIDFDKVTFTTPKTYSQLYTWMQEYNTDDCTIPFAFPIILNKKVSEKFDIIVHFHDLINSLPSDNTKFTAAIPMPFIWHIFYSIFEKHGMNVNDEVFSRYKYLKRLIAISNYILNEDSVDRTVIAETHYQVCYIANTESPEVRTVRPHNLVTGDLILLNNCGHNISGVLTEYKDIEQRVFQVEVPKTTDDYDNEIDDPYKFILIGENFSKRKNPFARGGYRGTLETDPEVYNPNTFYRMDFSTMFYLDFYNPEAWRYPDCTTYDGTDKRHYLFYITSDDFTGFVTGTIYGDYYNPDYIDFMGYMLYMYPKTEEERNALLLRDPVITFDPDYATHTYKNLTVYTILRHGTYPNYTYIKPESTITKISISETFKGIDLANHMPNMSIKDFINTFRDIGIISFVRNNKVDLKTFADIINNPDVIDISDCTTEIKDIDNPGANGYELKFTQDDNDAYQGDKLPVSSIDPIYTVKTPVATKSDLTATGSETNDVRLVIDENTYYVFNKSFLNADNNWKLLCYNNIDLKTGNGDIKINPKFSPLMPSEYYNEFDIKEIYDEYDVPCRCLNFKPDVDMKLRLASFYNLPIAGGITFKGFATSYDKNDEGNTIEESELTITWNETKGLKNVLLKEYLEWAENIKKDCKAIVLWHPKYLNDFDFSQKFRIRSVDYLIKSIKIELDFKSGYIDHNETHIVRV